MTFPMFAKVEVNGPRRHPVCGQLAGLESPFPGDIGWNFAKFIIARDGSIAARFPSQVQPDAPELVQALEKALIAVS